jgi:hypothetical protein
MSEKTSRIILIIEAVLIVLPITILAILLSIIVLLQNGIYSAHSIFSTSFALPFILISLAAILSGWRLFIAFLRGGASNLQEKHIFWWWVLMEGVLVIIASWTFFLLPAPSKHSIIWYIRIDFSKFILASPLLIPLTHLALEKFVRKPAGKISK